jgi:hypothetical protein
MSGVTSAHKAKDAKHKQQFMSRSQTFIAEDGEEQKYIRY